MSYFNGFVQDGLIGFDFELIHVYLPFFVSYHRKWYTQTIIYDKLYTRLMAPYFTKTYKILMDTSWWIKFSSNTVLLMTRKIEILENFVDGFSRIRQ